MFEGLFRLCTGETLEISQEMTIQNGDTDIIGHDEKATAMILQHTNDDDDALVSDKKLHNSKRKKEKKLKKAKYEKETKTNYAR